MDALNMEFPDNTFDLVWACESGEHMPDKKRYIEEMTRVLKPGGHLVIACWCQREETPERPLSAEDKANLQFLYEEWAHPYFISIQEFCRLMEVGGCVQRRQGRGLQRCWQTCMQWPCCRPPPGS
jgi:MPBQ/MSBQ methyltransferase